jgi:hypothetical protein
MADEVAGELDRLYKLSPRQGDGDLVFAHPLTGWPLPRRTSRAGCARRSRQPISTRATAFTTCGTRSGPAWPQRAWQCGRCRSGWGTGDLATTQIYADYAPSNLEAELIATAFNRGSNRGSNLSESKLT